MSTDLLALALGRCLARLDNLNVVHIPPGLDPEFAGTLARHASELRPEDPPFAIIVCEQPSAGTHSDVVEVTPRDATKYREGNRLAVFVGRPRELASLTGTFRVIFDASFPDRAQGYVDLGKVADACVLEVLVAGNASADSWPRELAAERLCHVLEGLRSAYEFLGSTSFPWNTMWMLHVSAGLHLLADQVVRADASKDLDGLFAEVTYAAFSLPTPDDRLQLRRFSGSLGSAIARSIRGWWCDSDTIASTVALLKRHPDRDGTTDHPLVEVDWTLFDRELARFDSPLLAFGLTELAASGRTSKFAALTEREFFAPVASDDLGHMLITDSSGLSLADGGLAAEMHVIVGVKELRADGVAVLSSPTLRVLIPTLGPVLKTQLSDSRLRIISSNRLTTFDVQLALEDGALVALGSLHETSSTGKAQSAPKRARLTIALDAQDSLAGLVVPSASASYVLLPDSALGLLLMSVSDTGRLGPIEAIANSSGHEESRAVGATISVRHVLDSASRRRVIGWTSDPGVVLALNGVTQARLHGRTNLWSFDLLPSGTDYVQAGELEVEIVVDVRDRRPISPIIAAIRKCASSDDEPSAALATTLRGELEVELAAIIRDGRWRRTHGHLFLPIDRRSNVHDLIEVQEDPYLAPREINEIWSGLGDLAVPRALVNSDEAETFRSTFEALEVGPLLTHSKGFEAGETNLWPSQVSWAPLWDEHRDHLAAYLDAYSSLVELARSIGEPKGVLWASYPFSATLWRVEIVPARCRGVLLSPLHPIRMAWLAAVESTLRKAESAGRLAGTVEGWNFPLVGPSDSRNGRLMAIPIDNGAGQIFLGWSMLVPVSTTGPEMLGGPEYVGNRPAPGSSASGLNSGAVSSALRDYRRLNPHVSTLTLDLSANVPAPRLEEIDAAVVEELKTWSQPSGGDLPAGARILDSLNRRGDVPRGDLSDLISARSKVPITWSRYNPTTGARPVSNVRILQDAGLAIEVEESGAESAFGVIGKVPLRRFEAHDPSVGRNGAAASNPIVRSGVGWQPFTRSLRQVEVASVPATGVALKSQLVGGVLASEDADWTVSGEVMVNPSALASMLGQRGGSPRMLWEWRPPFFGSATATELEPQLERRPYVCVVRVPRNLQDEIKAKLGHCLEQAATDEQVQDVLRTLGSRGIGLSSLTAMGGTHATGALGFFSTLRLIDSSTMPDGVFVLPIDACDKFLDALASDHESPGERRRADLLLIRLTAEGLCLVPIEIKFYGLEAPHRLLPQPASPALTEPLEQLAGTSRLLTKVASRFRGHPSDINSADHTLALNALVALVEAAIRLNPRSPEDRESLAIHMAALLAGSLPVSVGRPILAYMLNGATTANGGNVTAIVDVADPHSDGCGIHAEFLVNARALLEELLEAPAGLAEEWSGIVDWAFSPIPGAAVPQELGAGVPRNESAPELTPEPEEGLDEDTLAPVERQDAAIGGLDGGPPPGRDEHEAAVDHPSAKGVGVSEAGTSSEGGHGIRFTVGTLLNSVRGGEADFWPSNTNLNQLNIGVVGDLGTGKTQLLKALVLQLRQCAHAQQENPLSVLIFDYKRDFQDSKFISSVGGRVLEPLNIPLNVLALSEPYQPHVAYKKAQGFVDILLRIYGGLGPVQIDHLVTAITDLFERLGGEAPTLAQVLAEYRSAGQAADSVVSLLNIFVKGQVFSDDRSTLIPFRELINDQVLVVNLAGLGADQNTKNAIVVLFLNQYYEYMLQLEKWPYVGTSPQLRRLNSYLLIDEAVNIMKYNFAVLESLLLQGREFGAGVILSSQYLTHFQQGAVNYGEPLRTWFIHRVPNVAQKELQKLGLPGATQRDAEKISELLTHEAYYSSLGFAGVFVRGTPFFQI